MPEDVCLYNSDFQYLQRCTMTSTSVIAGYHRKGDLITSGAIIEKNIWG